MFGNYFKVAIRALLKNKLYSAINIMGLAIGLAACLLIFMFVRDELSYDQHWAKADNLARVHSSFFLPGREPMKSVVTQDFLDRKLESEFGDELVNASTFSTFVRTLTKGDLALDQRIIFAQPNLVDMFDFNVISGDLKASMESNSKIALSAEVAERFFGSQNPMGETLSLEFRGQTYDLTVSAIYENPKRSVLDVPALIKVPAVITDAPEQWGNTGSYTFVELKPGVPMSAIEARLPGLLERNIPDGSLIPGVKASDLIKYKLMNVRDLRLNSEGFGELRPGGDKSQVISFSAIAVLILVIASINFMNLTTAKSTQRAREVSLRKVAGASRKGLMIQFLGESVMVALAALFIAVIIVELSLPAFSAFTGKALGLSLFTPSTAFALIGMVLVVGVLSGLYPAAVLSGFRPGHILKANKSADVGGAAKLRNILVIAQFAISIALIVATLTVYGQTKYASSFDAGFQRENILIVENVGRGNIGESKEAFKQAVLNAPGVTSATYIFNPPAGDRNSNSGLGIQGASGPETIVMGAQFVDYDFLSTFDIQLVAGRDFSKDIANDVAPTGDEVDGSDQRFSANILVNELGIRRLGFASAPEAVGQTVEWGDSVDATIVGVVSSIQYQSLREEARPEFYVQSQDSFNFLAVRYVGDTQSVINAVGSAWTDLAPNQPFGYTFAEDSMAAEFEEEVKMATMLTVFSGLAIFVASLGLYGLASFAAERRTKEIGIRKVMGAQVGDIVKMLLLQFTKPVMISSVIALPLVIWGMMNWLQGFPVRMELWVLAPLSVAAVLITLVIAWSTVGGNALKVAKSNPIKALRYE